jgi:uncharacterized protein
LALLIDPLYVLTGLFVGAIVGLTGVGGGSLMTPLLILVFGIHPAAAVGTDLLFAATTKSAGTLVHGLNNAIDWRIVGRLALGSVPAAALTVYLLSQIGADTGTTARLIAVTLGVMLVLTAITLVFRKRILAYAATHRDHSPSRQAALTVLVGAVIGVLVSISSVGAGAIGVSALMLLYPRLPLVRIIGSDIAHAVPLMLVAGLSHWVIGTIDWSLLLSLLLGSIPAIMIASHFAQRVNEAVLRYALAVILTVVGVRLVIG